jgi:tetratricopeptide (TPR) repeat protein
VGRQAFLILGGLAALKMPKRFDAGVRHFLEREYEPAARVFSELVQKAPRDAAAWSYYGIALTHLGRLSEAESALSRAVGLSPQDGEAWFHLGLARAQRAEWPDAADAYRRAVALAPGDLVAWHRLGVALAESGEERAASAAFERALVLSRETPSPAREAAAPVSPHRLVDRTDEGEEPGGAQEAKSWLDLALSLLALGEEEEAVAAYERAYTLDPERARQSLFPPLLRLIGATLPAEAPGPEGPRRPQRPEGVSPPDRPEVG